mgnify:CR=1 FL=1
MELMDKILSQKNLQEAMKRVKSNKGASGIDKMSVEEIDEYFSKHIEEIKTSIWEKKYRPRAVKRVRPNRSAHQAMEEVLFYLNEGCEWVIDLDIEKYFDTVNHDKLISILREKVKDDVTLHLVRSFLRAGIMEDGIIRRNEEGVPQGGPLSPILSNIYLDRFDKELESRGLRFVRYADDCNIFVKSEMSANRVMKSVSSWLERKLFLKVNMTKTKVVRPSNSSFLGFTFWRNKDGWKSKPTYDRKQKLCKKIKEVLCRKKASALPLSAVFTKVNQIVRGWINYFRIGSMKTFLTEFGEWLRHKIRVIILKQWKKPKRIYTNLQNLNRILKLNIPDERIYSTANTRLGLYRQTKGNTINFLLSPKVLSMKNKNRPGLINPLEYYQSK